MDKEITLRIATKARTTIAALAASLAIVMAVSAAPALASEATWVPNTPTSGIKWSGSLTIYKNGANPKTCTFPNPQQQGTVGGSSFVIAFSTYTGETLSCTGGTKLQWKPEGFASYVTGYSLEFTDGVFLEVEHTSPYGAWMGTAVTVPFANAAGVTPSRVTFNNTYIGDVTAGGKVTATGTLDVKTNAGGKLTLTH